jgi:hypothetical protein
LDRRIQQRPRSAITAVNNQRVRTAVETRFHIGDYRAQRRLRLVEACSRNTGGAAGSRRKDAWSQSAKRSMTVAGKRPQQAPTERHAS